METQVIAVKKIYNNHRNITIKIKRHEIIRN